MKEVNAEFTKESGLHSQRRGTWDKSYHSGVSQILKYRVYSQFSIGKSFSDLFPRVLGGSLWILKLDFAFPSENGKEAEIGSGAQAARADPS